MDFVHDNTRHATEYGLALVSIEAGARGDELAHVNADAGSVTRLAGIFMDTDINVFGLQDRTGHIAKVQIANQLNPLAFNMNFSLWIYSVRIIVSRTFRARSKSLIDCCLMS